MITSKMSLSTLAMLLGAGLPRAAGAQGTPALDPVDRVRLAEAFRLGQAAEEHIWPGWKRAPFAVLLVTPEYEFLVRHPRPGDDFTRLGHDDLLGSDVFYRKRVFPLRLLATFPAVGGISTIVVGRAESTTAKTSTPWVVTLLHEHFHQLQDSRPGMTEDIAKLGISRGDSTGGWMLNYPFPYEKPEVATSFAGLIQALRAALAARGQADFTARAQDYLALRGRFAAGLARDDYRYLSFQIWKEGIARYTEVRVAQWAARHYQPTAAFRSLADYTPFDTAAAQAQARITEELTTLDLPSWKRLVFYPMGAAEGMLLDALQPGWQARYWTERFHLETLFP